jgi:hypothetical protein
MIQLTEEQQKEFEISETALASGASTADSVSELPASDPHKTILLALLKATAREVGRLRTGLRDDDQALLAWACRNLLELAVFVKYVLQSSSNAIAFSKDSIKDLHQMLSFVRDWQRKELPERDSEAAEMMATANLLRAAAEIEDDRFLRASVLAKAVDMDAEFTALHKICSKYIHPTAFSVLAAYEDGMLNGMNWVFFQRGALYQLKSISLFAYLSLQL